MRFEKLTPRASAPVNMKGKRPYLVLFAYYLKVPCTILSPIYPFINCYTLCYLLITICRTEKSKLLTRWTHFTIFLFSVASTLLLEYHRLFSPGPYSLHFEGGPIKMHGFAKVAEYLFFNSYKMLERVFFMLILGRVFMHLIYPLRYSQTKIGLSFAIVYLFTMSLSHLLCNPLIPFHNNRFGDFIRSFFEDSFYLIAAIFSNTNLPKETDEIGDLPPLPPEKPPPPLLVPPSTPSVPSLPSSSSSSLLSSSHYSSSEEHTETHPELRPYLEQLRRLWGLISGIVDHIWTPQPMPRGHYYDRPAYHIVPSEYGSENNLSSRVVPSLPPSDSLGAYEPMRDDEHGDGSVSDGKEENLSGHHERESSPYRSTESSIEESDIGDISTIYSSRTKTSSSPRHGPPGGAESE